MQLLIPYSRAKFSEAECTDEGYWDCSAEHLGWGERDDPNWKELRVTRNGCFRFNGYDGPFYIQPSHWRPLER